MTQRRDIVDHDDVSPRQGRGEVGRRIDQRRVVGLHRQYGLFPKMSRTMGETSGWLDHSIAVGPKDGQAQRHFSRQALYAADLHTDRRTGIDRDLVSRVRRRHSRSAPSATCGGRGGGR